MKSSGVVLRLEVSCRPSERRIGGQGFENARVFELS